MFEYIKWRGDLKIENDKFNKIDALICSRISYFPFSNNAFGETILKDEIEKFLDDKNLDDNLILADDGKLIKSLSNANRFLSLKISDYINKIDSNIEKQFSALVIHLSNKLIYISFRGTDNTIVGWKEDFNMCFNKDIPSQIDAANYVNKIMQKYEDVNVIIGGHSKGGNLAIYSTIFCNEEYKNRIEKVYNFDGPGFSDEVFKDKRYKDISNKIKTYLPEESVVGMVLNRVEKYKVVKSKANNIMQHDVYSWNINVKDFEYVKEVSKMSKVLSKSVISLLESMDIKSRKEAVDVIFDIMNDVSVNNDVTTITKNWFNAGSLIFKSIKNPKIIEVLQKLIGIIYEESKKEIIN